MLLCYIVTEGWASRLAFEWMKFLGSGCPGSCSPSSPSPKSSSRVNTTSRTGSTGVPAVIYLDSKIELCPSPSAPGTKGGLVCLQFLNRFEYCTCLKTDVGRSISWSVQYILQLDDERAAQSSYLIWVVYSRPPSNVVLVERTSRRT
jgi:hypothetical protein